ncbi:hypothetical protein EJB05_04910, partial [Eragrostis curvula]
IGEQLWRLERNSAVASDRTRCIAGNAPPVNRLRFPFHFTDDWDPSNRSLVLLPLPKRKRKKGSASHHVDACHPHDARNGCFDIPDPADAMNPPKGPRKPRRSPRIKAESSAAAHSSTQSTTVSQQVNNYSDAVPPLPSSSSGSRSDMASNGAQAADADAVVNAASGKVDADTAFPSDTATPARAEEFIARLIAVIDWSAFHATAAADSAASFAAKTLKIAAKYPASSFAIVEACAAAAVTREKADAVISAKADAAAAAEAGDLPRVVAAAAVVRQAYADAMVASIASSDAFAVALVAARHARPGDGLCLKFGDGMYPLDGAIRHSFDKQKRN